LVVCGGEAPTKGGGVLVVVATGRSDVCGCLCLLGISSVNGTRGPDGKEEDGRMDEEEEEERWPPHLAATRAFCCCSGLCWGGRWKREGEDETNDWTRAARY